MDEVTTYATPMDVLMEMLGVTKPPSLNQSVRVESAIEAIRVYHKQFDAQYVKFTPPVSTLEEKILEAKGYGVRFIKALPTAQYQETPDAIIIPEGLTTEGFEEELDEKIQYYRDRVFIDILKKHDLLK